MTSPLQKLSSSKHEADEEHLSQGAFKSSPVLALPQVGLEALLNFRSFKFKRFKSEHNDKTTIVVMAKYDKYD